MQTSLRTWKLDEMASVRVFLPVLWSMQRGEIAAVAAKSLAALCGSREVYVHVSERPIRALRQCGGPPPQPDFLALVSVLITATELTRHVWSLILVAELGLFDPTTYCLVAFLSFVTLLRITSRLLCASVFASGDGCKAALYELRMLLRKLLFT